MASLIVIVTLVAGFVMLVNNPRWEAQTIVSVDGQANSSTIAHSRCPNGSPVVRVEDETDERIILRARTRRATKLRRHWVAQDDRCGAYRTSRRTKSFRRASEPNPSMFDLRQTEQGMQEIAIQSTSPSTTIHAHPERRTERW
jgi:hypothetical protein